MLTRHKVDQFFKDVESLDIRFKNSTISSRTGYKKGNVSDFLNKKKPVSDNFINKFYEVFPEIKSNKNVPESNGDSLDQGVNMPADLKEAWRVILKLTGQQDRLIDQHDRLIAQNQTLVDSNASLVRQSETLVNKFSLTETGVASQPSQAGEQAAQPVILEAEKGKPRKRSPVNREKKTDNVAETGK